MEGASQTVPARPGPTRVPSLRARRSAGDPETAHGIVKTGLFEADNCNEFGWEWRRSIPRTRGFASASNALPRAGGTFHALWWSKLRKAPGMYGFVTPIGGTLLLRSGNRMRPRSVSP